MSEDFSSENKSTIAFKKLFNKAHTSPNKTLANELVASNVSIADSTIFAEALPSDPEAVSSAVVEKVTFNLVEDSTATGYAWKFQFPSDYSGSLTTAKANQFVHQYLGAVQLVPPTYGANYTAKVKDASGDELPFADGAFFIDYYSGVFFRQDQSPSHGKIPTTVEAFVYTGKMLNQVVSDIQTSVDNSQDSLLAGNGISITGATISADVTAASFSALTNTVNSLPNSIESLDDVNITSASLSEGQYLKWDDSESEWIAGNTSDFVTGVVSINNLPNPTGALTIDTDDIPEGDNKYATEANISAITFANALNASITGSSSKWTNGRNVALSGVVTGAVTLDGSTNVTIATTFSESMATQSYADTAADNAATAVRDELIGSGTLSASLDTINEIAKFVTDEAAAVEVLDAAILSKADKSATITAGSGIVTAGSLGTGATVSLGTISGLPTGQVGSSTEVPLITLDTHGRVTALSTTTVNNFDGKYSSLTGAPDFATAASFSSLKTVVDNRENILTVGDGLDLSAQGTLTANVTTIDGYVTSATFNALEATVDARKDIQNVSGDLSFSGSTLSTSFNISDYATAASFSSLEATVNARQNITTVSSPLDVTGGTLSLTANYATASSFSALSGRVGTLEGAGYLTSASTLASAKLDNNSVTIAGQSLDLGGNITADSLSDALKVKMNEDLGFDALSARVGTLESAGYLTAASTLSASNIAGTFSGQAGSVQSLSGHSISIADNTVSLEGGVLAAANLTTALTDSMRTALNISALATAASLNQLKTTVDARKNIKDISTGLTLSTAGTLSTSFNISDYQTSLSFSSPLSEASGTVSLDSSGFATSTQGSKADTALQPNSNISELTNDAGYLTAHPNVTAATLNLTNTGRTYIQSIVLDGNGHVTGVSTGAETLTDTTYSNGSGLSLTGTVFDIANTVSAATLNNPAKTVNLSFNEYGLITSASLQNIEIAQNQITDLTFGIADGNALEIDGSPAANQFAKFTSAGITGHSLSSSDIGLGNVENQALSTWAGSSAITTLGTISTGVWNATSIADNKISSSGTWNAKQDALTHGIADGNTVKVDGSVTEHDYAKFTDEGLVGKTIAEVKTDLALNNVENTALSTWAGSSNITSLGTISSGTWNASTISSGKIDSGITAGDVVKVSSSATSGEFAKFTATGLESTTLAKADVGLSNVENQALSSWTGSSAITTLGTITAGEWKSSTKIADSYIDSADDWNAAVTNIGTLTDLNTSDQGTLVSAINELDGEINTVEASVGLTALGAYQAPASSNYLSSASSVRDADSKLDAQIKTNEASIDLLEIRDGGLFEETAALGVYFPDTLKLSCHAGPFELDFAQIISDNGAADFTFFGSKSIRHQDRHFEIDPSTGDVIFTGTTL